MSEHEKANPEAESGALSDDELDGISGGLLPAVRTARIIPAVQQPSIGNIALGGPDTSN
jgi:hypothetical protein